MAAASGLPQLKAYLNGLRVPGLLRFHTLITKVVGITLVVSMGLPMGTIPLLKRAPSCSSSYSSSCLPSCQAFCSTHLFSLCLALILSL